MAAPGPAGRPEAIFSARLIALRSKIGREELAELVGGNAGDRFLPGDQLFLHHLHRDAHGGDAGAFAVAGLEHEELAVFHRELEVLHLAEMLFQRGADIFQLAMRLGHLLLQRGDGVGRAHAGDDILALRVDQVFTVKHFFARGGIAREGDAGAAFLARVAEDHRLDVDGGAPFVRDVVLLAINNGALVVPRTEDRADGAAQLLVRDRSGNSCPCDRAPAS